LVEQHIDGDELDMEEEEAEGQEGEQEAEIDLDNIDYEQLDPQILEIAEQMGVHPREVLKQLMQMNEGGAGQEDLIDEDGEDIYGQEEDEEEEEQ
jgi:hypothetical protein